MEGSVTAWPPAYANEVAAPAGEIPATGSGGGVVPSTAQLDWAHKALQVTFMGLALIGLLVILSTSSLRSVLRGAAKKHAVA